MEEVIFYGAGQYAIDNIRHLKSRYLPLCFVDTNPEKWGREIDSVKVLSIDSALESYPGKRFVITTNGFFDDIYQFLYENGVSEDSISFAIPREKRKGCDLLGKMMQLDGGVRLEPCCFPNSYKIDVNGMTFEEIWNRFQANNKSILEGLKRGEKTSCDGCSELKEGWWEKEPRLVNISLATGFREDRCNIRCVYCDAHELLENTKRSRWTAFEMVKQISECEKINIERLTLNDGEFTFNPHMDEILEICDGKEWYLTILTNGIIFSKKIADYLSIQRCTLLCSIDAGTRDTFKRVKGVDKFGDVYENIVAYGKRGDIILKYIFLKGINDNRKDIDGFIQLVEESGASVNISRDIFRREIPFDDDEYDILKYMIGNLSRIGIHYVLSFDTFCLMDMNRVRKLMDEECAHA